MTTTNEQLAALAGATEACESCQASGVPPGGKWNDDCATCHGSGTVVLIEGLRRKCPCIHANWADPSMWESIYCAPCWETIGHSTNCECHRLGWLPVSEAEVLPILIQWFRDNGWMVAIHNDYYLDGKFFTFWLFTHKESGRFTMGEGSTDIEAVMAAAYKALIEHV